MKGLLFAGLAFLLLAVPLLGACGQQGEEEELVETEVVAIQTGEGVESSEVIPEGPPERLIELDARADKDAYQPGEDITIDFWIENVAERTIEIAPFPPEVRIIRPPADREIHAFPAGTEVKSLAPKEVASVTLTWDQRDNRGQQVGDGYYHLLIGPINMGERWESREMSEMRLLVLPGEGVLEKSVEVNESQTVNGVTITLEHLELTATGAAFYAFHVPPDYKQFEQPVAPGTEQPEGLEPAPPWMMELHAYAEYSLDGGPAKVAGWSGLGFREDGLRLSWIMLDPVPRGTQELTLIMTKLGDREGPWEFVVSLE
jgi:hypothetical protein